MRRWYRFRASANRGCGQADPADSTATGRSRSDLIREAIEQYYKEDFEAAIDRAMLDGYTRIPDDEVDAFYEDLARRSIAEEPW